MKSTYILSKNSINYLPEIIEKFEKGSKIIILFDGIKEIITENNRKGEITTVLNDNKDFTFEFIPTQNSFYDEGNNNLALMLPEIKSNEEKVRNIFLVTKDAKESLIAIYNNIKVFSLHNSNFTPHEEESENKNNANFETCIFDTSYLANMQNINIFSDPKIQKIIPFFCLEELVNINCIDRFFQLAEAINNKDIYNIFILRQYTLPSSKFGLVPDLYIMHYLLSHKEILLCTCDNQMILEANLHNMNVAPIISINYSKKNKICNKDNDNVSSVIDGLTLEIIKRNNLYYIYTDNIKKVFKDFILQSPKIAKKFKGIMYYNVHLDDYVMFNDESIYQIKSLTERNNLVRIKT